MAKTSTSSNADGSQLVVTNVEAYTPGPVHKMVEIKITLMLDAVPGAWHQPEDFMRWACQHNYVQKAELLEPSESDGVSGDD